MKIVILVIISYILGSIPNALWIGKIFLNKDVRNYGSGNVGSTNAARVLGYRYGLLTLVLDVLKGLIPTYLGYCINPEIGIICGLLSIIGHSYSAFINFSGGKAVATTVGVFLIISPYSVLTLLFVFLIIVLLSGYVSLASMTSAILLPVCVYLYNYNKSAVLFSIFVALLIVYRHKSNIINIINKKEAKFFDKDK